MRIIDQIEHPSMRISIFQMNQKFLLKLEYGPLEQTYKFDEMNYRNVSDFKDSCSNAAFLEACFNNFQLMKIEKVNHSVLAVALLIAFASITRFIPHPANFTAIGAMALFGSARMSNKWFGLSIALVAMLISDFFMPFGYNIYVYASFIAIGILGFSIRNQQNVVPIGLASVASSLIFFLISNFGVWMSAGMYSLDLNGLVLCYTAAIPFFWNTLAGDLFFVTVLFGIYQVYAQRLALQKA